MFIDNMLKNKRKNSVNTIIEGLRGPRIMAILLVMPLFLVLGSPVKAQLGFGEYADAPVEEAVEESVEEAVEEAVEETVEETVTDNVAEQVESSVEEAVEERVLTFGGDGIDQRIEERISDNLEASIEEEVIDSVEDGVQDAVAFIKELRQTSDLGALPVGRDVVVIGGGMTAVDAAVQSKLLGAQNVTIAYRRGRAQMSVSQYEQDLAASKGVRLMFNAQPIAIHGMYQST